MRIFFGGNFAPCGAEIPAFAGMAVLFAFADNAEFGGIRKYKKTTIPAKAGISFAEYAIFALFLCHFCVHPPSHSCEGRNLIAVGANCRRRRTISRRFAAA
ncbi:MAG: hypothetical protein ACR2QC_02115 [Gammaproteobacteria bacterium]